MTWPGDWMNAIGRGYLLAADTDRDQVIINLKTAFVQGRLTQDELEERVGRVFVSRTYENLAAVTADLPIGRMSARPLGGAASGQAEQQATSDFRTTMRVVIAAIILAVVMWLGICFPVDVAFSG
jgi:Domain of unknown function (DUF1707)